MQAGDAILRRLERALAEGTTTAAACQVRTPGEVLGTWALGRASAAPGAPEVGPGTPFELASLTKVLATTSVAMALVDAGRLDLADPVARWLPAFGRHGRGEVTVADLLAHRAGLPAVRDWWRAAAADPRCAALFAPPARRPADAGAWRRSRRRTLAQVLDTPPEAPPGIRAVYSDAGFIVLGEVLARAGGAPLDSLFEATVARPLRLDLRFVPLPGALPAAVATRSSESRDGWMVQGEVDDDNAFALGGVAGHAGLFGSVEAVAGFGAVVLAAAQGRAVTPFRPETVRRFLAPDLRTPGSRRTLGWDRPSGPSSHAGRRLDPEATVGHLGFTGGSLWLDRSRGLVVALLTNRVHLQADVDRIRVLRADIHDLAVEAFEAS